MKRFVQFIVLSGIISFICGLTYISVQQNYRQSANDPQIQLAEDMAKQMELGQSVPLGNPLDMGQSLSPFMMIFNTKKELIATSGMLNGTSITPPPGVFDAAKMYGEDRVTWQPAAGVRIATVIVAVNKGAAGYVLAGRSLREVENRENSLTVTTGILWAAAIFLCGIFVLL